MFCFIFLRKQVETSETSENRFPQKTDWNNLKPLIYFMNFQILQKSLGTHHDLPPSRNSCIPQKWILLKTFWLIKSFLSVLGNNLIISALEKIFGKMKKERIINRVWNGFVSWPQGGWGNRLWTQSLYEKRKKYGSSHYKYRRKSHLLELMACGYSGPQLGEW